MQVVFQHSYEFSLACQVGGQWVGHNFTLNLQTRTQPGADLWNRPLADFVERPVEVARADQLLPKLTEHFWVIASQQLAETDLVSVALSQQDGVALARTHAATTFTTPALFSAAHRTHAPRLSDSQNRALYGKCDNPNGHGHNYSLFVSAPIPLDQDSEFQDLLVDLDHRNLSRDLAPLAGHNVVTETIAALIAARLPQALSVRLYELPDFYAESYQDSPGVSLGRIYQLPLAYQPDGQILGNTFQVEVKITGPLDPITETTFDLVALDQIAAQIFQPLRGLLLTTSHPALRGSQPALYNLALYLWEQFQIKLGSTLSALELGPNRTNRLIVKR